MAALSLLRVLLELIAMHGVFSSHAKCFQDLLCFWGDTQLYLLREPSCASCIIGCSRRMDCDNFVVDLDCSTLFLKQIVLLLTASFLCYIRVVLAYRRALCHDIFSVVITRVRQPYITQTIVQDSRLDSNQVLSNSVPPIWGISNQLALVLLFVPILFNKISFFFQKQNNNKNNHDDDKLLLQYCVIIIYIVQCHLVTYFAYYYF